MDYVWFGVFAPILAAAFVLGLIVGFNRGYREADEYWQEILAHKETLYSRLRMQQDDGWQPIETCPDDERVVLFCDERNIRWADVACNKTADYCAGFPPMYWRELPTPPARNRNEH